VELAGQAFQVVLFILPGFLATQTFAFFVPQRKSGDAELLAWGIAVSAVIWAVVSVVLIAVSVVLNAISRALGAATHLDLWSSWILPSLVGSELVVTKLLPGFALSVLGIGLGMLAAHVLTDDQGRARHWVWGHLQSDLNPRVWTWFLQDSPGQIYRITLKSGRVMVGQVTHYSMAVDDDCQELVLQVYSTGAPGQALVPVREADAALISRDDIELLERLHLNVGQPISDAAELDTAADTSDSEHASILLVAETVQSAGAQPGQRTAHAN